MTDSKNYVYTSFKKYMNSEALDWARAWREKKKKKQIESHHPLTKSGSMIALFILNHTT